MTFQFAGSSTSLTEAVESSVADKEFIYSRRQEILEEGNYYHFRTMFQTDLQIVSMAISSDCVHGKQLARLIISTLFSTRCKL